MRWLTEDSFIQPKVRSPTGDSNIQANGALGHLEFPHPGQGAIATGDSFIQANGAPGHLGFQYPDPRCNRHAPISSFRPRCDRQPGDSICSQSGFATLVGTAIIKLLGSIVTTIPGLKRLVFPLRHRRFWRSILALKSSNGGKKFKSGC